MFEPVAESKGLSFQTDIGSEIKINGNRQHLRQVFNNLIDNALKFTPAPGAIIVSLKRTVADPAQIEFTVTDTGVGIAAEELPKLFQRFYRGDRNRRRDTSLRSTGLGLSICQAVVQAHGGTIAVTSDLNHGSKFIVTFPSAEPSPEIAVD